MAPPIPLWRQGDVANHKRYENNQCELAPFRQYNLDTIMLSRNEKQISSRIYHQEAGNFSSPPPPYTFADLFKELTARTAIVAHVRQNRYHVLCDLSPVKLLNERTHDSWRLSSTHISVLAVFAKCATVPETVKVSGRAERNFPILDNYEATQSQVRMIFRTLDI